MKYRDLGFSAVELLITLFIATAFTATSYQLYSVVIEDGGDARLKAKASNIAYDNMRRYAPQATNPCTVFTPTPTPSIPANTLPQASITVTVTCPYGISANVWVTKIEATVRYGSPQQEVVHALYVTN